MDLFWIIFALIIGYILGIATMVWRTYHLMKQDEVISKLQRFEGGKG